MDIQELKMLIEENDVRTIDLKYCGLLGQWYHITMPIKRLDHILKYGVCLDNNQQIPTIGNEELVLIPDIDTASIDETQDVPILTILCSIHDGKSCIGAKGDPRSIAVRAREYLVATGIADEICWIPEMKFYIFDEANFYNSKFSSAYQFTSTENKYCLPEGYDDGIATSNQDINGRNINTPFDSNFVIRQEIVDNLANNKVEIRYHNHEEGLTGQQRIMPELMPLVKAADSVLLIKDIARQLASEYGASVTFMPKPIYNEPGNGLHFHVQLRQNGENLFYEKGRYADLSHIALYFIGGILHHGRSLAAFTNPSTNSYKRLLQDSNEPVKLFYGFANREAAVSVPKDAYTPEEKRIEIKIGDASSNPYLAMSAILMAGLDGIKNQIHPNELGYGPYEDNIRSWAKAMQEALKAMPTSLEEALVALKQDFQYLLAGDVFTKEFINIWIEQKMSEVDAINHRPHPYEMSLYYNL
ncbi:MAG: glutamine synthetase beta-grasp domain-containing protein [Candidatus Cloacimonadales bacterium]|jgi:glutamine synthetase|nr:glutamine synthetase beta-grasp domain-containing protein [Candidatus Cloacimonadales bacterium]